MTKIIYADALQVMPIEEILSFFGQRLEGNEDEESVHDGGDGTSLLPSGEVTVFDRPAP